MPRSAPRSAAAPAAAAYAMARRNRFLGRWLEHGEGYPDWNVRLFDRRRARWTDDPVHENVVADGPVARLAGDLLHASAESLDAYIAKQNRYTTLQAEAMHARGERASAARLVVSPLARFVRFYVLRARLSRRRAGVRPHRDRLLRELHEVREAARAAGGGVAAVTALPPARVLVTGCAGFIGMHAAVRLLAQGAAVVGVDNFDPYYDVALKEARLARLAGRPGFRFERLDLADAEATARLFRDGAFTHVVHLAAQPGVRYSLVNPGAYFANNLTAFGHVVEGCRHAQIAHLVYASSSSVYGANHTLPFSEDQSVDHPVSLYAATKKANELIAHSYSHLYRLPTTGLRFFTVYGPWGRPDMAPMLFTKAILAGEPIRVFNDGKMRRDFTYVDDIVEGVVRVLERPPREDDDAAPYAVYNIGNHEAVELETFIATLERLLGRPAIKEYAPMQPGDVPATYASIDRLAAVTGFAPHTPLADGLARFVAWYRAYHGDAAS